MKKILLALWASLSLAGGLLLILDPGMVPDILIQMLGVIWILEAIEYVLKIIEELYKDKNSQL